eukprot:TRINITY_DN50709_c0_g1_i1.p1 TRINITY_DN50709_c0_g1~~TRINITY_DN50709_c0_g1_i1.p1  ORF type:complete len:544 (-),score=87.94 TRINITY_DN50709_c0_g1_i1:390-1940(-)
MAGQGRGGNEGMSGMAMWKVKKQMAQSLAMMPINQPITIEDKEPPKAPNVIVDAVYLSASDGKQKPFARHVLVKDLNKIASRLNISLPKTGVFANKAPIGVYAIFDGQSGASEGGPMAAEFCARNFHTKLLENLAQLPPDKTNDTFVKAALIQSFDFLDRALLEQNEVNDGCGAVVALLIGEHLFTALLGLCRAVLCKVEDGTTSSVAFEDGGRGLLDAPGERQRVQRAGGTVVGSGVDARVRHPSGALSRVSRSLGDRTWKGSVVGLGISICTPDVQSLLLKGSFGHPYVLLCGSTVSEVFSPQELVDSVTDFQAQPRAACGYIATRTLEAQKAKIDDAQCTAVQVCFLPGVTKGEESKKEADSVPPSKKARITKDTQSMRLRHILVKHKDGPQGAKCKAKGLPVTRTRREAETMLRQAILDLRKDTMSWKRPPKDLSETVSMSSKKFLEICRELSECDSGRRGGAMCGDLGWVPPEVRTNMGGTFKDTVDVLEPGAWSDIAVSVDGLHLLQRVA